MTIFFSQVRESYKPEEYLLKKLNNPSCVMIGSGGCSVLSLLNDNMGCVDVIDSSEEQLKLIKLKIAIILFSKNSKKIIDFIEGRNIEKLTEILQLVSIEDREYWNKNIEYIQKGINNCGVFEKIFKNLSESNFNYEKFFNKQYLIEHFGENAVVHSLNKEFSEHFKEIIQKYREHKEGENNYFYHQILYGKYNENWLPKYLTQNGVYDVEMNCNKLLFVHSNLQEFIELSPKKYDLIQTSNITDWIDRKERIKLLRNCHKKLNKNGYIIMRRLNGDYNLKNIVKLYFKIIDIPIQDESFFYSEVIVGQRK